MIHLTYLRKYLKNNIVMYLRGLSQIMFAIRVGRWSEICKVGAYVVKKLICERPLINFLQPSDKTHCKYIFTLFTCAPLSTVIPLFTFNWFSKYNGINVTLIYSCLLEHLHFYIVIYMTNTCPSYHCIYLQCMLHLQRCR